MNLLVTGGCGFIGSHFIRFMLKKYPTYHITNLDNLTYAGNLNNTNDFKEDKNYRFVKGDVCDLDLVLTLLKDIDGIINFAAQTHVDNSIKDASSFVKTNILGTYTLLEAARINSVSRFMQISTDEVYGSICEGSFTEDANLKPNSPYSASKASADMLVHAYFKTYGINTVITRSSNNYGPNQHPEKLIPRFITNLLVGKKVPVYGNGMQVRDWLYVEDNCRAIDLVFHKGLAGEVYNIGGKCEKTNIAITKKILAFFGKGDDWIEYVKDRPGHDFRYSLDISKVMKLGWSPNTSFEEGIKKTIDWYVKNEWWWKPLIVT